MRYRFVAPERAPPTQRRRPSNPDELFGATFADDDEEDPDDPPTHLVEIPSPESTRPTPLSEELAAHMMDMPEIRRAPPRRR